jgi:hypothetical protein
MKRIHCEKKQEQQQTPKAGGGSARAQNLN